MESIDFLIVKVLMKLISLYIIRDILEVNIVKNPMPLGVGVSGDMSTIIFLFLKISVGWIIQNNYKKVLTSQYD